MVTLTSEVVEWVICTPTVSPPFMYQGRFSKARLKSVLVDVEVKGSEKETTNVYTCKNINRFLKCPSCIQPIYAIQAIYAYICVYVYHVGSYCGIQLYAWSLFFKFWFKQSKTNIIIRQHKQRIRRERERSFVVKENAILLSKLTGGYKTDAFSSQINNLECVVQVHH